MLTFARDRKVYWEDEQCGTIEPLTGSFRWGYIPRAEARDMPNILRRELFANTQREIKASLRRPFRFRGEPNGK